MSVRCAIYFKSNGVIKMIITAPSFTEVEAGVDEETAYIEFPYAHELASQYKIDLSSRTLVQMSEQAITATPSTIDADGTSKSIISGVEPGSVVTYDNDGDPYLTTAIEMTRVYFVTANVGIHVLTFKHPLYLDTQVTITASAP